jgi:hypothetical protein
MLVARPYLALRNTLLLLLLLMLLLLILHEATQHGRIAATCIREKRSLKAKSKCQASSCAKNYVMSEKRSTTRCVAHAAQVTRNCLPAIEVVIHEEHAIGAVAASADSEAVGVRGQTCGA